MLRIILLLAAILTGCARQTGVRYGAPLPPRPADSYVEVFNTKPPMIPYREVGERQAANTSTRTMTALLAWARELGANGLILQGSGKAKRAIAIYLEPPKPAPVQEQAEEKAAVSPI